METVVSVCAQCTDSLTEAASSDAATSVEVRSVDAFLATGSVGGNYSEDESSLTSSTYLSPIVLTVLLLKSPTEQLPAGRRYYVLC